MAVFSVFLGGVVFAMVLNSVILKALLKELYEDGYPLMDIESERLLFLDTVQQIFTSSGPGGGHLVPQEWRKLMDECGAKQYWMDEIPFLGFVASGMAHVGRDETLEKGNAIYDHYAKLCELSPYKKRSGNFLKGDEMIGTLPRFRYDLIRIMLPALDRAGEIAYRGKALHEAVITVLALKRWR